ncbi:hypothetical protein KIL84_012081, partial [Mauremys mutica]
KGKGVLRTILDLRGLNKYLKKLKFYMVSLASIIPSLETGLTVHKHQNPYREGKRELQVRLPERSDTISKSQEPLEKVHTLPCTHTCSSSRD